MEHHRDDPVGEADRERRQQGALEVAEAADDHDDERQQQGLQPHQVIRLPDRYDEHAGRRREHRADGEDRGVDAPHRNPEGLRHLPVELGGPHVEAEPGAGERDPARPDQRARKQAHDQLVAGVSEPGEIDPEVDRRLDRPRIGPVQREHRLLDDVEQADGGHDGAFRVVVDAAQDQPVRGGGDGADRQRGDDQRQREAEQRQVADRPHRPPREHRAQHEELAVGDVDDAHHAEDQRQPERRQGEDEPRHRALEHGEKQERTEGHARDLGRRRAGARRSGAGPVRYSAILV